MKPMFAVAELLPTGPGIRAGRLAWRSEVGRCSCAVRSLRTCRDGPEDRPTSSDSLLPHSLRANRQPQPLLVHLLVHSNLSSSLEIRVYE
jgi:hypothetical protein